ncbi:MAG: N-acetylmuramoyl-L-alanine amidase, partial [Elusimicrobia bacterium]|nr:N-acetylmuramoyl-L-alanine amidase [Elusimicrobiota bacterium]
AGRDLSAAARAPGDGSDPGRRFFDGDVLRAGGFAVPEEASVVVAPSGSSRRRSLPPYTRGASRPARDLDAAAPPAPNADAYPPSSAALAQGAGKVLAAFDTFQRRMFAAAAPILSRAGWHAAKRKGTAVAMHPTHVTVHHTEGPQTLTEAQTAAVVRNIQHYHMAGRAAEGKDTWDDIGYHFLIDGSGRVIEGRPAETLGAHAGGANQDNIGIAMMGDFNRQKPTPAQIESLTRLVSFLAIKYGQNPSRAGFLEPHRHYDQTDCPGKNMMAILAALRQKVDERTKALTARISGAGKDEFVAAAVTDA